MKKIKSISIFKFLLPIFLLFVITACNLNKNSFKVYKDDGKVMEIYIDGDNHDNIYNLMVDSFKKSITKKYNIDETQIKDLNLKNTETYEFEGKKIFFSNFQYILFGERKDTLSFYIYENRLKNFEKLEIVLDEKPVNELNALNFKYENGELSCGFFNPYTYTDDYSKDIVDFKYKIKFLDRKFVLNTVESDLNKEHDLYKAIEFTDLIAVGLLKIDSNKGFVKCLNPYYANKLYNRDFKAIEKNQSSGFEETYVISLYRAVDLFNAYNKNVYSMDTVYNGIKNEIKAFDFYDYEEIDDSFENYDKEKLRNKIHPNKRSSKFPEKFKLIYFLKDKKYCYGMYPGAGGIASKAVERDKWEVSGDSVKIKFYKFESNEISDDYILLKLNNKKYSYNKKKSKYYIEENHTGLR